LNSNTNIGNMNIGTVNCVNDVRSNREMLMRRIQTADFEAVEANLYLDAYPESTEALEYFYKVTEKSKQLKDEYAEKFGPLTASAELGNKWNWIDSPWPWEGEY